MKNTMLVDHLALNDLEAGSRHAFDLRVSRLADGRDVTIPVNVLCGTRPGPCLVAVAGIHGDEADGIMALMDLWGELAPDDVTGRLVLVPVANLPAFQADQRRSPLDDLDLNRLFPGNPDGSPSERLAAVLFEEVIKTADFVFSLHGFTYQADVIDYVEFNHLLPEIAEASYRACQASGFNVIRISSWPQGLMTNAANRAGIPGMEAEVGGLGIARADYIARYKGYTRALMQHLGMLPGVPPANLAPRLVESFEVMAPTGGVLRMRVELGDEVQVGDVLATIHDLHGNELAAVRAPDGGLIGARLGYISVNPGDRLLRMLRDVDTAVIARPR